MLNSFLISLWLYISETNYRSGCNEHNFASRMECFRCNAPRDSSGKSPYWFILDFPFWVRIWLLPIHTHFLRYIYICSVFVHARIIYFRRGLFSLHSVHKYRYSFLYLLIIFMTSIYRYWCPKRESRRIIPMISKLLILASTSIFCSLFSSFCSNYLSSSTSRDH